MYWAHVVADPVDRNFAGHEDPIAATDGRRIPCERRGHTIGSRETLALAAIIDADQVDLDDRILHQQFPYAHAGRGGTRLLDEFITRVEIRGNGDPRPGVAGFNSSMVG